MDRMERERKTIEVMIGLYCKEKHRSENELCTECSTMLDYTNLRLDKCRYGSDKTTCSKCTTHCYKPDMKEEIKKVMRYSGPKMIYKHPILAIHHLRDGFRKPKLRNRKGLS
ncbi:MAG: nitrous oxide-stimulated promoter family protein [Candidatus Hodarchaeales archaeon]